MMHRISSSPRRVDSAPAAETAAVFDVGRLHVYAAISASAGSLPLPWVPEALIHRVRGAMVHDIAARHGLSLTAEARHALAGAPRGGGRTGFVAPALRFVATRLVTRTLSSFAPFGVVWPLRGAISTYVLGRLFDRYLKVIRREPSLFVDAVEARRVRSAIDGALAQALAVDVEPPGQPSVFDDDRDRATVFVDDVLELAAGIPARLTRRLDAAFDLLMDHAKH